MKIPQLAYITNNCFKLNNITWAIIECQKTYMTIHYYSDSSCDNEISDRMYDIICK